jgi:DNA polymerase
METFEGCSLRQTATQLVFADGTPGSRLVIVGEAPGRDEDLAGKPFVGRSGQLLDRMLVAIGLDRSRVYIINVVPWRPPGNRKPTPMEAQICRPFAERQIALSGARIALLLGGAATSALLGRDDGIVRLRGRWYDLSAETGSLPALAAFHPAYLLRAPAEKRLAWRDFMELEQRLLALG